MLPGKADHDKATGVCSDAKADTASNQRLAADARTPDAVRHHLQEIYAALDPIAFLRDIRDVQERLTALADTQPIGHPAAAAQSIASWQAYERLGRTEPCDQRIDQS